MGFHAHLLRSYGRHLLHAGNRHNVHSPFVFGLVEQALRKQRSPVHFPDLEALRSTLLKDRTMIPVIDLGAGSHRSNAAERRIRDIARTALKPRAQAELLHRITRWARPTTALELGTSLGITTLYLARAMATGRVVTIEGSPAIHGIAQRNFRQMDQGNIQTLCGSFGDQLPVALGGMDRLDLAFIDGHHALLPTLDYFERCLTKAHEGSMFIFDDIHWSPGMEQAWAAIQAHSRVSVTIDLYKFGLVFLRKGQQREHFRLRY